MLAAGIVSKYTDLSDELAAYQAEAAWQLGQWTDLNEFTKMESTPASWEMNLSRVVLAAYKTDKFLFKVQLLQPSASAFYSGEYIKFEIHIFTPKEIYYNGWVRAEG